MFVSTYFFVINTLVNSAKANQKIKSLMYITSEVVKPMVIDPITLSLYAKLVIRKFTLLLKTKVLKMKVR